MLMILTGFRLLSELCLFFLTILDNTLVFSYPYLWYDVCLFFDEFSSPFGVVSFLINVFDVSQTKGKELPVSVSFRSYVISY